MDTDAVEMKWKIDIQPTSSRYTDIGTYNTPGHSLVYSPEIIRTGNNYYDSRDELPEEYRMSTAEEELAIQLALEKVGQDPRKAVVFNDLFGRKNEGWNAWQWTETGLRVPKGYDADKYEKDGQGRKYFPRIVLIGDQEIGEVLVPQGNGRAVVEWDEVFGIPKITGDIIEDGNYGNRTTHFYFNPNPEKDIKSGEYDVAVVRGAAINRSALKDQLSVIADRGRFNMHEAGGIRPAQGSLSEIKFDIETINSEKIDNIVAAINDDATKMTARQFKIKYIK